MKHKIYKGHHIETRSVEYRSGGWPAEAVVEWQEQGHAHTFQFHHPEGRGDGVRLAICYSPASPFCPSQTWWIQSVPRQEGSKQAPTEN